MRRCSPISQRRDTLIYAIGITRKRANFRVLIELSGRHGKIDAKRIPFLQAIGDQAGATSKEMRVLNC